MTRSIIAKRYAKALLKIGLQDGNHEILGRDLDKMAERLELSRDLRRVLRSPVFPKSARKTIAGKVGERLGLAATTVKFIKLLIHRKRMDHFFMITEAYQDLADEAAGRTRVTLFAPLEVAPGLVEEIKTLIESLTGKEALLSFKKDPSLIGGVLIKNDNVVYDGSLKAQIAKLREKLFAERE